MNIIRDCYDAVLRERLPRKLGVLNGVTTRSRRLFDAIDIKPEYEAELVRATQALVEPGDDVTLVGAGYGVSSVYAARATGPDGHVTAIEASGELCEILREAAEINGVADRITVRHGHVGTPNAVRGAAVGPRIPVDDLGDPDVLIMDCEGAEREIVPALGCAPARIIVETHGVYDSPTDLIRRQLDTAGYDEVGSEVARADWDITIIQAERRESVEAGID